MKRFLHVLMLFLLVIAIVPKPGVLTPEQRHQQSIEVSAVRAVLQQMPPGTVIDRVFCDHQSGTVKVFVRLYNGETRLFMVVVTKGWE